MHSIPEHVDVLIVGAGISGIGAAYHLQQHCADRSYVILEALAGFGGTWRTHTYPGIRSDSDLHTFGYAFKPWKGAPIATAAQINDYLAEVIDENGLDQHIRYGHRITAAAWSSDDNRWHVTAQRSDASGTGSGSGSGTGSEQVELTADFLLMCQGYYRHSAGYLPDWPGMADYQGRFVHAQTWPDDLDVSDKQVIVIGSGATAATLIPALAGRCEHVTMLQRSPTYFIPGRNANDLADQLRELEIDDAWIHEIVRRRILLDQHRFTERCQAEPEVVRAELIDLARAMLPERFDVETHFSPRYRPWQQRLAFIPDGDLFTAISDGHASVVTNEIDCFTEKGIRLADGEELVADIIVAATGFELCVLGDIDVSVDGEPVEVADTVTYRGMMFTGVPNLAWVFGYFRASWTLRADLVGEFVCRLLNHMDDLGVSVVTPGLRPEDADMPLSPWLDEDNFNPGYMQRGMHLLPRKGDKPEWQHSQDYWSERVSIPAADLDDGCLRYR